ncbi:MAG TPA: sigma 54-interacting transcriptional regulator [Verrucomicrobiae bacterium]|nr:sigma 54-interacting transcriptional regulator [Verrucomicrobiae bacterium]
MPSGLEIAAEQRELLSLVAHAAFANPFTDDFDALQLKIAGCDAAAPQAERIKLTVERWNEQLHKLHGAGVTDFKQIEGEDREILRHAFLYEIYHRFLAAYDQLIADQLAAGERSVPVPFVGKALRLFARRGFGAEEARRYFAIFYQIRRAYFFIDHELVGCSPCMKELRRRLWNNVFTHDIRFYERYLWNRMEDFSTLLLGETGTGKGTAAAAIGRSGFIPFDEKRGCFAESFTRTFLGLNLSQFPEALIESELFGHKKGSFTGAVADHQGAFARCSPYGAIFLDEIGDAAITVQIKLLQVLQERTFVPVGSHERLRFRGRVIAATNKPLEQLRRAGQFRDDFFYRLCSDVITVPPLRQRIREDVRELNDLIALIVTRLTGQSSEEMVQTVRTVIDSSLGRDYAWPGNVRELEQSVRRILLTRRYDGDHRAVAPDLRGRLLDGIESGVLDAEALLAFYCALLHERHNTYEEVARRTNLDRRTVKGYIEKHNRIASSAKKPSA